MLVPLTAIVTTSLPMAAAIVLCAKDRKTVHAKNKGKSSKSKRSSKSARAGSKSSKGGKSSRSHRSSKSQRSKRSSSKSKKGGKSSKSGEHGKSAKSGKSSNSKKEVKKPTDATSSASAASIPTGTSGASEKSTRSSKSSRKGSKSSKSRKNRRLDQDAQNKMEKSAPRPGAKQTNGGEQMAKSLVEEVNAIKHSNQLAVVPAKLQYQTLGGVNQIELKNTSGDRKAFKVKCSDNALYRVNPVVGFAEPHSSVKIDVLRLNGEQKTDKLVLLTADVTKDVVNPHGAFSKSAEHREMMVVPLVAA